MTWKRDLMQSARLDTGEEVAATAFATLSASERASHRGSLSCPYARCAAPAFFRKRSIDGRPPLFYSNEHIDGCVEKSRERRSPELGEFEDEPAIWNSADEFELRYDDPTGATAVVRKDSPMPTRRRGTHRVAGAEDRSTHATSIGLRPLLRRVRDGGSSLLWDRPLTLNDGTRGALASIVHRADPGIPLGARVIVWGQIALARGEWINSGLKGDQMPAVRIPESLSARVAERARVSALWELTGWWFMVEGAFRLSAAGSPYVTLDDERMIAFLPDR